MPRTWTKTDAFAHFGTIPDNTRWSWSAESTNGDTVVLVLWQDVVKRRDGALTYADDEDLDAAWRRRPGHSARVRHLKHCRDHLDGRFRAIIAKAEDVKADPRKIESCFPQRDVWWQLDSFDEKTGAFTAHVVK